MRRIAVIGAGISGLTAAWQLTRPEAAPVEVTLFEASDRTGGIVETVRRDGFVVELGPDSWVSDKPAAREFVTELGLAHELVPSNDSTRKTYLLFEGELTAMPEGFRLMVPTSRAALDALDHSSMFSPGARQAFRNELKRAQELQRTAPIEDESISSFTERHFGREVLERLASPLLSGVFGGDVDTLSVRAVMGPFVAMERERGSLIAALEEREAERSATGRAPQAIFTTLQSGLGTMTDTITRQLPRAVLQLGRKVQSIRRADTARHAGWIVRHGSTANRKRQHAAQEDRFDTLILATPGHVTAELLKPIDRALSQLLPAEASSAILVALAWTCSELSLPPGFGFLVPPPRLGEKAPSALLATTFADQKFGSRAPEGGRLLRAFFGGDSARTLLADSASDEEITQLALGDLSRILNRAKGGELPQPTFTMVRRWPLSLPQYGVGHLERIARLDRELATIDGLHLLGNGLRGVGLPDLIREARTLARDLLSSGGS